MSKVTSTIKAVTTVFRATFRGYQTNQITDATTLKKLISIAALKNSFIRHHSFGVQPVGGSTNCSNPGTHKSSHLASTFGR